MHVLLHCAGTIIKCTKYVYTNTNGTMDKCPDYQGVQILAYHFEGLHCILSYNLNLRIAQNVCHQKILTIKVSLFNSLHCSIKVLDSQMRGFFSFVIDGINHVISRARSTGRRSVISMSLIGSITPPVNDAITEAVANNIVVVTAAGNFRQDSCRFLSSSSPDVINVGAIQEAEDPDSRTPCRFSVTVKHV